MRELLDVGSDRRPRPDPALAWYGQRLRRRRVACGVSQAGMAHAAGVSQSTISRIENAQIPHASMLTVARMEHALHEWERHRWD